MTRNYLVLLTALVLVLGVATAVVIVDETEHVVVTQFGRPTAIHSAAGLYFKLPAPIQRVTTLDKRILLTEAHETEFLTADKKNVVLSSYLSWRIAEPLKYLRALRTREFAELRLQALVMSELGSAMGDLPFTRLVPTSTQHVGLAHLEWSVQAACRDIAMQDFGIDITGFGVTRLSFPMQNLQSVFARMRAEREQIARGYRSEGKAEAQKLIATAERDKADVVTRAEADAARIRGEGEAKAARIYAEAYSIHEDFYRFLGTLAAYEKIFTANTTLVLPADAPFLELLMSRIPKGPQRTTEVPR